MSDVGRRGCERDLADEGVRPAQSAGATPGVDRIGVGTGVTIVRCDDDEGVTSPQGVVQLVDLAAPYEVVEVSSYDGRLVVYDRDYRSEVPTGVEARSAGWGGVVMDNLVRPNRGFESKRSLGRARNRRDLHPLGDGLAARGGGVERGPVVNARFERDRVADRCGCRAGHSGQTPSDRPTHLGVRHQDGAEQL